jgi:hypothetical protein
MNEGPIASVTLTEMKEISETASYDVLNPTITADIDISDDESTEGAFF